MLRPNAHYMSVTPAYGAADDGLIPNWVPFVGTWDKASQAAGYESYKDAEASAWDKAAQAGVPGADEEASRARMEEERQRLEEQRKKSKRALMGMAGAATLLIAASLYMGSQS